MIFVVLMVANVYIVPVESYTLITWNFDCPEGALLVRGTQCSSLEHSCSTWYQYSSLFQMHCTSPNRGHPLLSSSPHSREPVFRPTVLVHVSYASFVY